MRLIVFVIIIWILGPGFLGAQINKGFVYYNQKTYELYLSKDWKTLIEEGKEAIREGFDFFYLRQRLGIAYSELRQYGKAVDHFYAALDWNRQDLFTQEYLYYSLLLSGRSGEARLFESAADQGSPVHIFALGSYKWSDQQTAVDALEVYSTGLSHSLSNRIRLTHTLEYINQRFVEIVEEEIPRPGGNGPPRIIKIENRFNTDQQLYRLGADVQWGKGWKSGLTFQHIWGGDAENRFNEQAYWVSVGRSFSIAKLEVEGGYANFSQQDIFQLGMNVAIYPMANTRIYYLAGFTYKQAGDQQQHWVNQRVGVKLAKGLWGEALLDFGEINYYQEMKGAIAYNIGDLMHSRIGGNLQFWPTDKTQIYLQYQLENKTYAIDLVEYQHQGLMLGVNLHL